MAQVIKAMLKLAIMVALAVVVIVGAFGAGYVARAFQAPVWAPSASTFTAPQSPQVTFTAEDVPPEFEVFWEAWTFVEGEFYGDVPSKQDRVYGAIRGMVNAYGDENTAFIEPDRAAIFREDVSGSFEGIGAAVRMDEMGRLVIAEPFAGRPAAESGLARGDIVLAVDGQSLQGLSLYESIGLIRGPAGSTVVLTVFRDGGKAHVLEQLAHGNGVRRGVFDELEAGGAHRVFPRRELHGESPVGARSGAHRSLTILAV